MLPILRQEIIIWPQRKKNKKRLIKERKKKKTHDEKEGYEIREQQ